MIPFFDLKAQHQAIKHEIADAVDAVFARGQFVLGSDVDAFEKAFAAYCGTEYAVAVNSGTSALHVALLAAGIGPDDEVVTVPMTFVATVAAITYTGARVVLADIDPDTWTLDPVAFERAITPRTRAVIPVHLHGLCADMDVLRGIASAHDIVIIEDAAQAHGAEFRNQRAGGMGDIGCFSFYPSKTLGGYGEGGIAVTSRPEYARTMRLLRNWGEQSKGLHVVRGFNYRMDAMQGAILGVKLRHLDDWIGARQVNAALYDRRLGALPVVTPNRSDHRRHTYHIYAIRTDRRDALRAALDKKGIATGVHYPRPVHLQPAYADLGYAAGDFPVSEGLANEFLSLPMYPELSAAQNDAVCSAIEDQYGHAGPRRSEPAASVTPGT